MDAPYDDRVSDEKLRNLGRSELQFDKKYLLFESIYGSNTPFFEYTLAAILSI